MLENPAPLSLNFSSPMKYSSKERSSHIAPSLNPTPKQKKIPLTVHFPITITVYKHWSKFVTCSPSPRDCEGVSHPRRHNYYDFRLCGTKWLSQSFDPLALGKNECGRGSRCLPIWRASFFWKRTLELFISVRMSPRATLYDHFVDTMTPGKKKTKKNRQTNKQINTHPWSVFWQKNTKFHIFVDWTLKLFL